jgi:hypothetical protein
MGSNFQRVAQFGIDDIIVSKWRIQAGTAATRFCQALKKLSARPKFGGVLRNLAISFCILSAARTVPVPKLVVNGRASTGFYYVFQSLCGRRPLSGRVQGGVHHADTHEAQPGWRGCWIILSNFQSVRGI